MAPTPEQARTAREQPPEPPPPPENPPSSPSTEAAQANPPAEPPVAPPAATAQRTPEPAREAHAATQAAPPAEAQPPSPAPTASASPQAAPAEPPTAPASTATLAPMKLALATGALRSAVAAALSPVSCAIVRSEVAEPDGTVSLLGVVGHGAPETELHRAVTDAAPTAAVDWRVASFDGPYCRALDLLRPIAYSQAARGSGFSMSVRNGERKLKDGELITIDLQLPKFPAWLLLDYFQHDGTVVHLYPTAKDTPRTYPPASRQTFGDPTAGGERWEVGAPYGTDMIVAIASSAPLFAQKRKDLEETDAYLRALQAAVETAERRSVHLAVDALVLTTGPRL